MIGYPSLTDIEAGWRKSGSGLCIIVEGETVQEDPWFYGQWFDNEARRFTFFPQDGWAKVGEAVAALRQTLGERSVYGIRDRDFDHFHFQARFPRMAYASPANTLWKTTCLNLKPGIA